MLEILIYDTPKLALKHKYEFLYFNRNQYTFSNWAVFAFSSLEMLLFFRF